MVDKETKRERTRKIIMIAYMIFFWIVAIYNSIYPSANFYDKYQNIHLAGLCLVYINALFCSFIVIFWDPIYKKWLK